MTLRIWGGNYHGSKQYVDRAWWRHQHPCTTNKSHVLCVESVKKPNQSSSQLWVDGSFETNFTANDEFTGFEAEVTIANRKTNDDFALKGGIAAMEFYTGMKGSIPDSMKRSIMLTLC